MFSMLSHGFHCSFYDLIKFSIFELMKVAEGVSTAGAVIALAQKYNVKMPVLTAVARIIDNELTPKKAVYELMNLPQVILDTTLGFVLSNEEMQLDIIVNYSV